MAYGCTHGRRCIWGWPREGAEVGVLTLCPPRPYLYPDLISIHNFPFFCGVGGWGGGVHTLRIELRALLLIGKRSTIQPNPQPHNFLFLKRVASIHMVSCPCCLPRPSLLQPSVNKYILLFLPLSWFQFDFICSSNLDAHYYPSPFSLFSFHSQFKSHSINLYLSAPVQERESPPSKALCSFWGVSHA